MTQTQEDCNLAIEIIGVICDGDICATDITAKDAREAVTVGDLESVSAEIRAAGHEW